MNLLTLTGPTVEPVTLAEVYLHLRLDPNDDSPADTHPDDALLTMFIGAARAEAEKLTRRAFVSQRLMLVTEGFPAGRSVPLLRPPVLSILSVSYYDVDNALQTVDPGNYFVTDDQLPLLQFIDSYSYPATYASRDSLRIEYTAGYEPDGSPPDYAGNVPGAIKAAVLIGVQLLYDELTPEKRERLERARAALLEGYKVFLSP